MPKNPNTVKFFTRYARFYLQGIIENDKNTCWRVTGTDSLSTPGVLQIHAEEYYSNLDKDDLSNLLPKDYKVEEFNNERSISYDDIPIIQITYDSNNHFVSNIEFNNVLKNYSYKLKKIN